MIMYVAKLFAYFTLNDISMVALVFFRYWFLLVQYLMSFKCIFSFLQVSSGVSQVSPTFGWVKPPRGFSHHKKLLDSET